MRPILFTTHRCCLRQRNRSWLRLLNRIGKTIFCIDGLLREMENGGFAQFFRQEAGAYSDDTLDALERIKAKESAALLRKMLNYFSDGKAPPTKTIA